EQGGEFTEHLATTYLHSTDLGESVAACGSSRGFRVDHHEGGLRQRRAQLVERQLGRILPWCCTHTRDPIHYRDTATGRQPDPREAVTYPGTMRSAHHEQPRDGQSSVRYEVGAPPTGSESASDPDPASAAPPDWDTLPNAVRERIVRLAAQALGNLERGDIPRQLRPVARFAPAKRAKAGAAPLAATLSDSPRFRAAVVEWLREHRADTLDPNDDDPVAAAAAAVLLGEADASARVTLAARNAADNALRAERDAAVARARRLETELQQTRDELTEAQHAAWRARSERSAEVDKLKSRLREQGGRLRQARDAAE